MVWISAARGRTPSMPPVRQFTSQADPRWYVSMAAISLGVRWSPPMPSKNSCPTRCASVISASLRGAHVADRSGVAIGLPELPELPDQVALSAAPDGPEVAAACVGLGGAAPQDATATAARHNSDARSPS